MPDETAPSRTEAELAEARRRIADLEAQLAQLSPAISTLELTVQSTTTAGTYRVKAEWNRPGDPVARERRFTLNDEDLFAATSAAEYGAVLGRALFADDVLTLFALARGDNTPVRVLLAVESEDLQRWRWERLCAPGENGAWRPLRPDQLTPFSLYIPTTSERRYPAFRQSELRALVVVASPEPGHPTLSAFDEELALRTVLDGLDDIPRVVLSHVAGISAGPPTLQQICARLSAEPFTLLHVVCHGAVGRDGASSIFLDADDALPLQVERNGRTARVPAAVFVDCLRRLGPEHALPHFAFLSVCESAVAAAEPPPDARDWRDALRGLGQLLVRDLGMKSVLAMTDKITQSTALALGRAFYPALQRRGEVDLALAEACIAVRDRPDLTTPALFSRVVGRRLFSPATGAPTLTRREVDEGVRRLVPLFAERAPVLVPTVLPRIVARLADEADRRAALDELEPLCDEVLETSFADLARGAAPSRYEAECPFPGLRAFTSEQRRFFRGRDALVTTVVEKLMLQSFVCVLGGSGSGKSSLVAAGVIPALRDRSGSLAVARLTPGRDPEAALTSARASLGDAADTLLFVDQFEELFTLCDDAAARARFLDDLVGSARPERRVVLTMRADFLGDCAAHAGLRRMVQRQPELVPPMTADELRGAVEAQAKEAGLRLETGLSESLLPELVREPGAMPLLQHALAELWARRHGRWLRRDAWERDIGGVAGAIERTAEDVWARLDEGDRTLLPSVMTRLTRVGGTDGGPQRDTRQRVALRELAASGDGARVRRLVTGLAGAGARLLVVSGDDDGAVVEVAHEALLRHWKRLRGWIDAARDVSLMRQELRASAQAWIDARKADDAWLEHRGTRAEAVRSRLAQGGATLDETELRAAGDATVTGSVAEYFAACVACDRAEAERREEAARRLKLQLAAWYEEKGAALVTAGDGPRAMVWLVEALKLGADSGPLRFRLARAAERSIDQEVARIAGHTTVAVEGMLSPDETRALVRYEDGSARVWDAATGALVAAVGGGVGRLNAVTARFSADGAEIVTRGGQGNVGRWSATTGEWSATRDVTRTVSMLGGVEVVEESSIAIYHSMAPAAEEDTATATATINATRAIEVREGHAVVVDARSRAALVALPETPIAMEAAEFDATGTRVLTRATGDASAKVWEALTGALVVTLVGHTGPLLGATFAADGARALTFGEDGTARVWNALTGAAVSLHSHEFAVLSAVFDRDGAWVVSADYGGCACVWDAVTGAVAVERSIEGRLLAVAFTPAGACALSVHDDYSVSLWNLATGKEIARLKAHEGDVHQPSFSADGSRVVTSSADGSARLWDTVTGRPLGMVQIGRGVSASVRLSPGGERFVTWTSEAMRLWDAGTERPLTAPGQYDPATVAFSADGKRLVVPWSWGGAIVWDLWRCVPIAWLTGRDARFRDGRFSADGRRVVTASEDGSARLWDVAPRVEVVPPREALGRLLHGVISADGRRAAGCDGRRVRVWDAATGATVATFERLVWGVRCLAIGADGVRVITGDSVGVVRVYAEGQVGDPLTLPGHTMEIESVAFDPEGRRAVSATSSDGVRVWDLATVREVAHLDPRRGAYRAAFDGDSDHVVTWGRDEAWRWDMVTGEVIGLPAGAAARWSDAATGTTTAVTFDRNGALLLRDLGTDEVITEVGSDESATCAARFSADGRRLTLLGVDGCLRTVAVSLEARTLAELDGLVSARVPHRLVDGKLR